MTSFAPVTLPLSPSICLCTACCVPYGMGLALFPEFLKWYSTLFLPSPLPGRERVPRNHLVYSNCGISRYLLCIMLPSSP
ncbi:hypothetical protein MT325_m722L [Paramecium bursaria chlorella virus MT325]|uniref:Uncharacterized protein m722L n=1 Tax=Paramecium bursaria Chlorella virus MT325 TaxID=346932 RepID=A7IVA2_PBCVM|nr:hypothetical protein MT325_m722L [Paramecium bursaria chlorella virus MT325]